MNKRLLNIVIKTALIDLIYLFGALLSSDAIRIVATVCFFGLLLKDDFYTSFGLLVGLSVNQAIVVLVGDGISLIGIGYFLLAIKIMLIGKFPIYRKLFIPFLVLLIVGFSIILRYNAFYDFALFCELFLVLSVVSFIFKVTKREDLESYFSVYLFGALLCSFNLLAATILVGYTGERVNGVMDNANYIGVSFAFVALCCLLTYLYKINIKRNLSLFFFFVLMLALTGSRGSFLGLLVAILWLMVFGICKIGRLKFFLVLLVLGLMAFNILYNANVTFVVNIYNNLILRTIERLSVTGTGQYMDISSGRFTLWQYYFDMFLAESRLCQLFGIGAGRYYLQFFGGYSYGQMAHNVFIGSLMGSGIIGTGALIVLYVKFFKLLKQFTSQLKQNSIILMALPIVFTSGYLFLDGSVDLRLPVYIAISVILQNIICHGVFLSKKAGF